MFLNSHLRLNIPSALGDVFTFDRISDPATRVPNIIAFQNDGEVDVTLHFDAGNNKAQITTGAANFNITGGTNDTLKLAVDGEAPITITLTAGATRSAANIVTDLNTAFAAATGNTALALARVVNTNHVAITSGTLGQTSSIEVQSVTHNAATTLGLTVGVTTAAQSFNVDIVSSITVVAKGMGTFTNPRPKAPYLKIRGQVGDGTTGVATVIDATPLFAYNGVQQ